MAGETPFNSHIFGAEHQMVEDEVPLTDIKARRKFGAHIKQITATDEALNHAKNKHALMSSVFRRLSISCNDEPENLLILPPLDVSIRDKISIFKINGGPMPMPTETDEERKAFRTAIHKSLPGYKHYLVNSKIPDEIRGTRYAVKEYQHPDILDVLNALSPEQRLEDIIDACLFNTGLGPVEQVKAKPWEGSATDLERELTNDNSLMKHEARKLFCFNNAGGTYLHRLSNRKPEKYRQVRTHDKRLWTIAPPGTDL